MDNKITEILQKTGLSNKEIAVYLALLQLNTGSVLNIAKKANLKRPTCYLLLEDLLNKGLVSVVKTKGGIIYKASNPEIILNKYKTQQREIEDIIPQLKALANLSQDKPKIEVFEGKEGINTVYQMIGKSKKVLYWSNIEPVQEEYKWMFDLTENLILKNKVEVREIVSNNQAGIDLAKKRAEQGQKVRISKNNPFSNDNAIFDDKIAIFSIKADSLFVVLIQNKEVTDSLKSLYELAWETGLEPDKV